MDPFVTLQLKPWMPLPVETPMVKDGGVNPRFPAGPKNLFDLPLRDAPGPGGGARLTVAAFGKGTLRDDALGEGALEVDAGLLQRLQQAAGAVGGAGAGQPLQLEVALALNGKKKGHVLLAVTYVPAPAPAPALAAAAAAAKAGSPAAAPVASVQPPPLSLPGAVTAAAGGASGTRTVVAVAASPSPAAAATLPFSHGAAPLPQAPAPAPVDASPLGRLVHAPGAVSLLRHAGRALLAAITVLDLDPDVPGI
jgi:hypothetical protein